MTVAFTVDAPRPFEANPGIIAFHARRPVDTIEVRIDGKRYRVITLDKPTRRATIGPIGLPSKNLNLTVVGWSMGKAVGRQTTTNVLGLPRIAFTGTPTTTTATTTTAVKSAAMITTSSMSSCSHSKASRPPT
jgi:hypothetical protein